jgi:hypothetical protein
MHGIKVLAGKNYVDNLSEEARKEACLKAKQGIWPSQAPLGYLNTVGPHGKKIIVPDPDMGPIVSRVFEWFETGDYALRTSHRRRGLRAAISPESTSGGR